MIHYWHAVILGVVEALTEFFPISSTFHLIMTAKLLQLPQTDFMKLFEVCIQSGAVLAIVVFAWRDFLDRTILSRVLMSFGVTAIGGVLMRSVSKQLFAEYNVLLFVYVLVGLMCIVSQWLPRGTKRLSDMSWADACIAGVGQACALVPGVSRSGAVMLALLARKYEIGESARYSFLLAVPTIFAASAYDLLQMYTSIQNMYEYRLLFVGTVVASVVSLVILNGFVAVTRRVGLVGFGWYRIASGFVIARLLGVV